MSRAEAKRGAANTGDDEGVGAVVPWSETSYGAGRRARMAASCVGRGSRAEQGCGSFFYRRGAGYLVARLITGGGRLVGRPRGFGAITAGGGAIMPGDDDLRIFLVVEI